MNNAALKPQPHNRPHANDHFYQDVIEGLRSSPKHLQSKYFYDAAGDKLFQAIMNSPEYYLTNCELEIFSEQTEQLAEVLVADGSPFDLIELGAGDATKSAFLLKQLVQQKVDFTYLPIDISANVITYLNAKLPVTIPGLKIKGLRGEYFEMLNKAAKESDRRKVVLFMGSNIGNMPVPEAEEFCREMRKYLSKNDMVLIGVDLKKDPKVILAAYNDKAGVTREFNLNLLKRINTELDADFNLESFDHYPMYDPETGACKSYLISLAEQDVTIGEDLIHFKRDEYIYMEISQKYDLEQINAIAAQSGFKPGQQFFDSKRRFVDAIWLAE